MIYFLLIIFLFFNCTVKRPQEPFEFINPNYLERKPHKIKKISNDMIDDKFYLHGVKFKDNIITGKITNFTDKDYSFVKFKLLLYNNYDMKIYEKEFYCNILPSKRYVNFKVICPTINFSNVFKYDIIYLKN